MTFRILCNNNKMLLKNGNFREKNKIILMMKYMFILIKLIVSENGNFYFPADEVMCMVSALLRNFLGSYISFVVQLVTNL